MSSTEERDEWLAGMRAMADFLEAHPDVPLPSPFQPVYFYSADAKAELARIARAIGNVEKMADDHYFGLTRNFGPIVYTVKAYRDLVCERVVTGKRTVTRSKLPEGVSLVEVTEEEDIVEWVCPPSILAFGTDTEAVPA